jgi:hypothetical protein
MKHIRISTAVLLISSVLLSAPSPTAHAQSSTSVLIDWNPSWDSTFGAAAAPPRPPITTWLKVENGMLTRDGQEFIFFGTGLNEASTAIGATARMTDADNLKAIRRIAAAGFNALRLQGMCSKDMTVSAANYGCWDDATGPEFSETFMVQLDKTIARANELGLQVWIGSFNYGQAATRTGYPAGISGGHGMSWSKEFRDKIAKPHILRFADRVNTQTGVKYRDNPGIVWQPYNEDGFSNSYFSHDGWFDAMLNPSDPNSYWMPELDAKIRDYYAGKGWALPDNQFPARSTYDGWSATDKQHFMQFMGDTDLEYATEMYDWFKSLNPNIIVAMSTFNYTDGRVLNVTDIASRHIYSRVPSGDAITNPPNYQTRTSILQDPNGFAWGYAMGGSRLESVPFVIPEVGDYGLNRWDYERTILEAIVHGLQKTSGFFVFNESQSLYQAQASGIQYIHHHVGAPTRRLGDLLAAPIVEYRFISPLPEENTAVLGSAEYLGEQASSGVAAVNSFSFQNGWDGSERGYWLKRLYMSFGAPHDTDGYPKILDAAFASGVQIPNGQVFAKSTGVTVNAPSVVGLVNDLKNTTIGPMTLSGVTAVPNAIVMIRSDADYPLFAGPAKLFVHQNSTVTDAAGWTGTQDGETVTSWGSPGNTRLVVPLPFTITFNTGGIPLDVSGVNEDGTTVALPTIFDGTNVRFSTDTRFPLYLVVPKQATTFADALPSHPYFAQIEALYRAGYTSGCSTEPLMFCPDTTMNRAESAVFVERGIHSASYVPPSPSSQVFADLSLDSWAASWVDAIWQDKFTQGCGTNPLIYCPWQGHTRAEGSVFYLRMLNGADYVPPPPTQRLFADVPLDAWYAAWMHEAYAAGLLPACQTPPDLRLCPEGPLSRGLAAYMMVQAKGLPLAP